MTQGVKLIKTEKTKILNNDKKQVMEPWHKKHGVKLIMTEETKHEAVPTICSHVT